MTKLDPSQPSVVVPPPQLQPAAFEPYIDKKECARRLGKSLRTIDTYIATGRIPYYKTGRTVSFKWSEVDAHWHANFRVCLAGRV